MSKISLLLWLLILSFLSSCKSYKEEEVINDFDAIVESKKLTIVTLNTSTTYFIYKDEAMGYDYDMVRDFCRHHGLTLNVKVAENATRLVEMISRGEANLIACGLPVQNQLKDSIRYCGLARISHQVLVQRQNRGDTLIKDVSELIGKNVYVKYDTKFHHRLVNLNKELGGGIHIKNVELDTIVSEDLIRMVSTGRIKYTLSDEDIALLNKTYYNNINISLPVSGDQRSSWAVHKNAPLLAKALDEWFVDKANKPVYRSIVKKYFESSKQEFEDDLDIAKHLPQGAISIYDELFKQQAKGSKYDWQLLAAISYQESRFENNLTSWAGAAGIMGLMLRTAESLGLTDDDRMNPEKSIGAAIQMMNRLDKIYKDIELPNERLKFMLAAYNGGMGHVSDAQQLAKKYGADPKLWEDNVKEYIRLKRYPEYYNDPVCKSGYFRGTETLRYVYDVLVNYERFKQISK